MIKKSRKSVRRRGKGKLARKKKKKAQWSCYHIRLRLEDDRKKENVLRTQEGVSLKRKSRKRSRGKVLKRGEGHLGSVLRGHRVQE